MHRAIIFANGRMNLPPDHAGIINSASLIIAADGGHENCKIAGVQPHVLIGDLDSIQPVDAADFRTKGIEVIQHPTHKDETDLELALLYVAEKKYDEVYILGALGDRWDMTIANILLLAHPRFTQVDIHILDGQQELILIRPIKDWVLMGGPGMTLSLIPLDGAANGITTRGLEYPLENENLLFGATRGISNVFIDTIAQVSLINGLLLCVINRNQPFESRNKNSES